MVKRARIASGPKSVSPPKHTESTKYPDAAPEPVIASPPSTFKVVVGTYEKLLYGLEGHVVADPESEHKFSVTLIPVFIFPAHVACVRAVAASPQGGKWLATGSTDEIVKIWDLRRRKEVGGLVQHQGSITRISFPSRSHLLSASEDGTLALFSTRDWTLLRTLKGHKGRVNDVSTHPSGKIALSVGKDRTLRMWDMMRGKGSASTKLGKEGELVRWSVSGKIFVVQAGSTLEIFQTDMSLLDTITHTSRVHDVRFWAPGDKHTQELLLVAAEDKLVTAYQIDDEKRTSRIIAKCEGHTNRVKALDILQVCSPESKDQKTTLMSTASSDGTILVYDLAQISNNFNAMNSIPQLKPIASYDTKGSRLVCLTMADGDLPKDPGSSLGKSVTAGSFKLSTTFESCAPVSFRSITYAEIPLLASMSEPSPSEPQPVNATKPRKGGRDRGNESVEVRHSKTLSYILRHGAAKERLAIRPDGYVLVTDLVRLHTPVYSDELARPKLKELDLPRLLKIVDTDQKQRYQLGVQSGPEDPHAPILPITPTQTIDPSTTLWIRANQGHTLKVDALETKPITEPSEVPCAVHGTTLVAWESITAMAAGILFNVSANGVILTTGDTNGFLSPVYFSSVERKVGNGWEEVLLTRGEPRSPAERTPA